MASTKDLQALLETASKEPKEQVAAGQIPMPPVLLFAPRNHTGDRPHAELLEITGKIFLELGERLVKKQTYNQTDTADQVLQAAADVANAAGQSISRGSVSRLLDMRPAADIPVNRDVPREDVHRQLLDVLFSHLDHGKHALQDLDNLLQRFVKAFSTLPTEADGKHIIFTFFVTEAYQENIGNAQYPILDDVQSITLNTIRMETEVYHELVRKNEKPPKSQKARDTSSKSESERNVPTREPGSSKHSTEQSKSWLDIIRNWGSREGSESESEPDPPENNVALKMDYRMITMKLKSKDFQQAHGELDQSARRAVGKGLKDLGEAVTNIVYVPK